MKIHHLLLVFCSLVMATQLAFGRDEKSKKRSEFGTKSSMFTDKSKKPRTLASSDATRVFDHFYQLTGQWRLADMSNDSSTLLMVPDDEQQRQVNNQCDFFDIKDQKISNRVSSPNIKFHIIDVVPSSDRQFALFVKDESQLGNYYLAPIDPNLKPDANPHKNGINWLHADKPKGPEWNTENAIKIDRSVDETCTLIYERESKSVLIETHGQQSRSVRRSWRKLGKKLEIETRWTTEAPFSNPISTYLWGRDTCITSIHLGQLSQLSLAPIKNGAVNQLKRLILQAGFESDRNRKTYFENQDALATCGVTGAFLTCDRLSISLWNSEGIRQARIPFQATAACFTNKHNVIVLIDRFGSVFEWNGKEKPVRTIDGIGSAKELRVSADSDWIVLRCKSKIQILRASLKK